MLWYKNNLANRQSMNQDRSIQDQHPQEAVRQNVLFLHISVFTVLYGREEPSEFISLVIW
jgi:hypothetical protein